MSAPRIARQEIVVCISKEIQPPLCPIQPFKKQQEISADKAIPRDATLLPTSASRILL